MPLIILMAEYLMNFLSYHTLSDYRKYCNHLTS